MKKYIVTNKEVVELVKSPSDVFWYDKEGTIYALNEEKDSFDPISRCGIGWFSLPQDNPLNPYCAVHDYEYSSSVYQAFHTREEADRGLYLSLQQGGASSFIAGLFSGIARQLGKWFWENKKTNI